MPTLQDKVASPAPVGLDRKEMEVYRHLDPKRLPRHIAIIMDGNGRWAKRRHMPRVAGHRAGVRRCARPWRPRPASTFRRSPCMRSPKKTGRSAPEAEVDFLMRLLCRYLKARSPHPEQEKYPPRIYRAAARTARRRAGAMEWAREATAKNTGMVLTLALNYSARTEIVDAFRSHGRTRPRRTAASSICRSTKKRCRRHLVHAASARPGSGHSHQRRDAAEQFPAVAAGVCRNLCDADAVAGFSRRCICSKASRNTRSANGATAA